MYPVDLLGGTEPGSETGLTRQVEPINLDDECRFIRNHRDEIVGVGEVGLDYKWSTSPSEQKQQRENFQKIIAFVEKLRKPIIVHSRKAENDCVDMLESSSLKNVQLHCFAGNKKLIRRAADLGFYFSIPTHVTRLQHFQMMSELVDISQLLTETDAPWLSPVPGETNEPANVVEAVNIIAKHKAMPFEEVKEHIWKNYKRLFG
jgi:TatD DNase family protein